MHTHSRWARCGCGGSGDCGRLPHSRTRSQRFCFHSFGGTPEPHSTCTRVSVCRWWMR